MDASSPAVLILAAGRGTRMKSETPKVLHPLLGRPLIEHVLAAALYLRPARVVVVTGFGATEVEFRVRNFLADPALRWAGADPEAPPPQPLFARQTEQLGTGHAVSVAREALADFTGPLVIMSGDVPLVAPDTLTGFLKAHQTLGADLSVLTVRLADPAAYGRILRDSANWLERIVEFRDATEEERAVREINTGLYVADTPRLFEAITRLSPDNDQKEYYLTDVVADFRSRGLKAAAVEIPEAAAFEVRGINDRYELAEAQVVLRDRVNESWLRAGVTMLDPFSTFIELPVRLANDVTLWPGVLLTGRTTVGAGAEIGPYTHLHNCRVPPGAKVPGHRALTDQDL